jgi:hypothetical protein
MRPLHVPCNKPPDIQHNTKNSHVPPSCWHSISERGVRENSTPATGLRSSPKEEKKRKEFCLINLSVTLFCGDFRRWFWRRGENLSCSLHIYSEFSFALYPTPRSLSPLKAKLEANWNQLNCFYVLISSGLGREFIASSRADFQFRYLTNLLMLSKKKLFFLLCLIFLNCFRWISASKGLHNVFDNGNRFHRTW